MFLVVDAVVVIAFLVVIAVVAKTTITTTRTTTNPVFGTWLMFLLASCVSVIHRALSDERPSALSLHSI